MTLPQLGGEPGTAAIPIEQKYGDDSVPRLCPMAESGQPKLGLESWLNSTPQVTGDIPGAPATAAEEGGHVVGGMYEKGGGGGS